MNLASQRFDLGEFSGKVSCEQQRGADHPIRWLGEGTWCAEGVRPGKPGERGLRLLMAPIQTTRFPR